MTTYDRDRATVPDLEERIGNLEREGRFWRRVALSLLALLGPLALVAAATQQPERLSLSELNVGESGQPTLRITGSGITLFDASGKTRIAILSDPQDSLIAVRSDDSSGIVLLASPAKGSSVSVVDKGDKTRLGMDLGAGGGVRFFANDTTGREVFRGPLSED